MIDWASVVTYFSGANPDVLAINSSGAATQDGTEWIAELINNGIFGWTQDALDYAGIIPNGVTEAAGASQIREALQLGNAIGPGFGKQYFKFDDPSVTGDRALLLAEQGVLIASYVELDAACYVGDGNNAAVHAAGGKFYRSSDSGGATPNIAGPYLQLPPQPEPTFLKSYIGAASGADFVVTGQTGFSIDEITAIPFKTIDGQWIIDLFYDYTQSSNATGDITVGGIVFKTGIVQPGSHLLASATGSSYASIAHRASGGSNVITIRTGSASTSFSGHLRAKLDSKPTWADDLEYPMCITY